MTRNTALRLECCHRPVVEASMAAVDKAVMAWPVARQGFPPIQRLVAQHIGELGCRRSLFGWLDPRLGHVSLQRRQGARQSMRGSSKTSIRIRTNAGPREIRELAPAQVWKSNVQ